MAVQRTLQVGATVFAIGILVFFAARSVGGGLAGILLSALLSALVVGGALAAVSGLWRESRKILPRHAVLGGCLTGVALCATGGVVFCFGSQLLVGLFIGGVAAVLNQRQGWIQGFTLIGTPAASTTSPQALPSPAPLLILPNPAARTAAVALAIALVLGGLVFGGLGAGRALEDSGVAGDILCTAPCGMQRGLWVQVLPDTHGDLISFPAPDVAEIRLSFHDDAPGERDVSRDDFTLSGPDPKLAFAAALERPECLAWKLRLQLDDAGKVAFLCFSVHPGAELDLTQLQVNWGPVVMQLGAAAPNFFFQTG